MPLFKFKVINSIISAISNIDFSSWLRFFIFFSKDSGSQKILINGKTIKVNVHICTDKEKALLWPEIVEFYSGYQRYQSLTKRNIPVLQLTSEGIKTIWKKHVL